MVFYVKIKNIPRECLRIQKFSLSLSNNSKAIFIVITFKVTFMVYCMNRMTEVRTFGTREKFKKRCKKSFFSEKFKEIFDFPLNSGNFYVTLQSELCPDGS